jgi:hypothetical protein
MKENFVHQEKYKDFEIEIYQDTDPMNPRDNDNLGTMACYHRNYRLGDLHNSMCMQEINDYVKRKDVISLPLYLYDHSGITMNTTGFSCPWDSGQVGYIYVTYENIRKNFSCKHVTKEKIHHVLEILKSEVSVYNDYIMGNVYGYILKRNGGKIDSCWGFIGDWDGKEYGALVEAKSVADNYNSSKCFIEEGI